MSSKVGVQAGREALAQKILIGCALFGAFLGAGSVALRKMEIAVSRPALFVFALALLAVTFVINVIYWRNIDEAAREAHKFAWLWGGTGGILVTLPLIILISSERLIAVVGERSPGAWVVFGMSTLLAAQAIGYGLVWAGWWLRQR